MSYITYLMQMSHFRIGIVFDVEWNLVRLTVQGLLLILTRWQVNDKEATMPDGALILVSNHLSWVDAFVLMASLPRQISFMIKRDEHLCFLPRTIFFRSLGAFPANRVRQRRAFERLRWARQ
jgi:1-acyl-sn-glycerol-3-phosphate acyltransferase